LDAAVPRQLKNVIREAQEEPREVREERDLLLLSTESENDKAGEEPRETKEEGVEEQQVDTQEYELEVAETAAETEEAAATEVERKKQQAGGEAARMSDSFPNEFLCPITLELMRDPAVRVC
jgi:hypothetical protein